MNETKYTNRIEAVDALRGFDMFWIIGGSMVVDSISKALPSPFWSVLATQMQHEEWQGFRFFDLIFPLFLFLSGVSTPFSIKNTLSKGLDLFKIHIKLFKRMLLLILLGWVYNGILNFEFENFRYASVLGRIGLAWYVAALLFLHVTLAVRIGFFVFLLLGYYLLMMHTPMPGFHAPVFTPQLNWSVYVDTRFMPGKLYFGDYDPEGLLSSLPAVSTAMLGAFCGEWLQTSHSWVRKTISMLGSATVFLLLGYSWDQYFPIVKNVWTSTFVLVAGGWSILLLSAFYILIDGFNIKKWAYPFKVIGSNSISAYLLTHRVIDFKYTAYFLTGGIANLLGQAWGNVSIDIVTFLLGWLLLYYAYLNNYFLKV